MQDGLCLRLRSVAELVRQGAVLADVGTDHAYLPLFLLEEGKISRAVCSDVNEGPLSSARANAEALGYIDKITFLLTDGLLGVLAHAPTDIAICGMGGELIARILADSPEAHRAGLRFLLQPMSRQEVLRERLCELGFSVLREVYSLEGDKPYLAMLCEYTGEKRQPSCAECLLGTRLGAFEAPMMCAEREYFLKKEKALLRRRNGRKEGGEQTAQEDALLSLLQELLHTKESRYDG